MHKQSIKSLSARKQIAFVKWIRGLSLLYLSLYLPLLFTVYVPGWYKINCHFHDRCEQMPQAPAEERIIELYNFLTHRQSLASPWTLKEQMHLLEARSLLDKAFIIAGCAFIVLVPFWSTIQVWWPKFNIFIILILGSVLPFFRLFWAKIFHPLFFNNQMWLNTYKDVSYYIMPSEFFKHTVLIMVLAAIILNGALYCVLKHKTNRLRQQ